MDILVVDDERAVRESLRRALELEGYGVELAADGEEALHRLSLEPVPDAVVLDILMPGVDGLEVCRRLRSDGNTVPVLMLTARSEVDSRVAGLDAGADDYLPKPFAVAELLARLRSLTRRRTSDVAPMQLTMDDLVLDLVRHEVRRNGRRIELSPREFTLLEYFLRHPGQALTRTQLLEGVWGYEPGLSSNLVDAHVHNLREKIDRGYEQTLLHTVRGDLTGSWGLVLWLAPAVIVGAQLGARLSSRIHARWILKALAVCIALVGLRLLF